MNSIHQHPAHFGRNAYGVPVRNLDIEKQVRVLVDALGQFHLKRHKLVSTKTASDRHVVSLLVFRQLREAGYALKSVFGLSRKHIGVLAKLWESQSLCAATMQTRFSHLRWLAKAIGKEGLVSAPTDYGVAPEAVERTYAAEVDKSWSTNNVEVDAILAKVAALDSLVACQLRLMYEFGLRAKEAILIRPALSHAGDSLRVEEGTKGGRSRVVPIRYEGQIAALEAAKVMAKSCKRGTLIPVGATYDMARNRFYYVVRLAGISKAMLGVTSHGLRHQYANDLYEELSGQPSVVRGASEILNRAADKAAREAVTQDLGHARLDVTPAYTGPMKPRRRIRVDHAT